jgi:hypothetical protein
MSFRFQQIGWTQSKGVPLELTSLSSYAPSTPKEFLRVLVHEVAGATAHVASQKNAERIVHHLGKTATGSFRFSVETKGHSA